MSLEEVFYKIGEEEYHIDLDPECKQITEQEQRELDQMSFETSSSATIIRALTKQRLIST